MDVAAYVKYRSRDEWSKPQDGISFQERVGFLLAYGYFASG